MRDEKYYEELWDKAFKIRHFRWDEPHPSIPEVCRFFKKHNVKKILDLGCGAGRHAIYFAKRGFYVVGLDSSKTALKIAERRLKKEGLSNYDLVFSSLFETPFSDGEFDAVISISAIDNFKISDIRKGLKEVRRILKKGGFLFADFASNRHENFLEWKELGWKKINSDTFFHPKVLLQSFFTEKKLLGLLDTFEILKMKEVATEKKLYEGKTIKAVNWEALARKK